MSAAKPADLELIAQALAQGQRAAWSIKSQSRSGGAYGEAQRMLLSIYEGMEALQRMGGPAPRPCSNHIVDVTYRATFEAIKAGVGVARHNEIQAEEGVRIQRILEEKGATQAAPMASAPPPVARLAPKPPPSAAPKIPGPGDF